MFVDTNIFVDFLRGRDDAVSFFESHQTAVKTSVIVELELIDGLKSKRDIAVLQKHLFGLFDITIIQINDEISAKAESIFKNYRHSHGISINDSLIAATAISIGEPLITHNKKHFSFIRGFQSVNPY